MKNNNPNKAEKIRNILFLIIGVLSIIFAIKIGGLSTGSFEMPLSYGGDAYTGIQNACAGAANNAIDVAITQDVIIGKVIKIYENAGIWQKILTTPQVVVMIFVTLILFDLAFSYKGFKNKQLVKQVDQIDLEQVAKKSHDFKFNKEEIKALYNKMDLIKKNKDIDLNNKEKELLEYTIRLDLSELQKEINDKLNKEE